jgi:hypothetical protein
MPRQARIKPPDVDTVYHIYNRIAGDPGDLPFGNEEKNKFVEMLNRLSRYYCVEILSYSCLSNHWHILVAAPAKVPSNEETACRYAEFYNDKRWLKTDDERCTEIARRLRDVSWFARDLQQRFTTWYNHSCGRKRRGGLWAGRFKSCILEKGLPLWECLKYIEMNAVRAHIVNDPADYPFCSWGVWDMTGKNPFAQNLMKHVAPNLDWLIRGVESIEDLQRELRNSLARALAYEKNIVDFNVELVDEAPRGENFHFDLGRRCRYWVDAAVIGSKDFVRETVSKSWGEKAVSKRQLKPAKGAGRQVYSYRSLRRTDF